MLTILATLVLFKIGFLFLPIVLITGLFDCLIYEGMLSALKAFLHEKNQKEKCNLSSERKSKKLSYLS